MVLMMVWPIINIDWSKYRSVGLVHQQIISILRQIILYTQILSLSQLRNQKVTSNKQNTDDEVRVNVSLNEELVEDEW